MRCRFYAFHPAVSARVLAVHLNSLNAFISWFKLTFFLSCTFSVPRTRGRSPR